MAFYGLFFFAFFSLFVFSYAFFDDEKWPATKETTKCAQNNKQKANYLAYRFKPSLRQKPLVDVSVEIRWDEHKYAPWVTHKKGTVYAANTIGIKGGVGGYFGTILSGKTPSGTFLFSLWDKRKSKTVPAKYLTWPITTNVCKRNCQDCGGHKYGGLSTGTQCHVKIPKMSVGDHFKLRCQRITTQRTIDTREFGGMPKGNIKIKEFDRNITGAVWRVTVVNLKTKEQLHIGDMLFEGKGQGIERLGAFDEMVGCNKCNDVFHRNTRFGPFIDDGKGVIRKPITIFGINRARTSTCQKFGIYGSKQNVSATFEMGPGSTHSFKEKRLDLWRKQY